jgi:hypothetical protein
MVQTPIAAPRKVPPSNAKCGRVIARFFVSFESYIVVAVHSVGDSLKRKAALSGVTGVK